MTEQARGRGPLPPRVVLVLGLLLLAVASMEWKGYRFGGSNHSIQVPFLKHLVDPSLYTRDPLLSSFEGYVSFFFHGLALVVRAVGQVEPVYFVLYTLFHAAALGALYAVAMRLFASPPSATLACLLYIGEVGSLGAEFTYWPRFSHAHAATALLLFVFYLYLSGRFRAAFALCGLVFNLHGLYAAYVFVLIAVDSLSRWREPGPRRVLANIAVFLVAALPALVWLLGSRAPGPSDWWPLWLEVMRERSGPHVFPFTVPAAVYGRYLLLLALGGLGWAVRPEGPGHGSVARFAIAAAALCLAGLLFAEYWPARRIIEAQLLRSTKWLTVFVLIYVARLFVASWSWGGLARGAVVAATAGLLLSQPAWLALGLALYLVGCHRSFPLAALAVAGAALFVAAVTQAAPVPERMGLQQAALALGAALERPVVIACLVGFVVLWTVRLREGWLPSAVAAVVGLMLPVYALPRIYQDHLTATHAEPWNEVQSWVRAHTPRDAVILTPPHLEGFRVFSERAIVGEWKDGTQQFFSPSFTLVWRERMQALGGGSTPVYDGFDAERLLSVARRYQASFLVVSAESALPFHRLFANDEFAVYRVPELGAPAPPQ